ncbi:hypothetical protein ACE102_21790 [Bradyrhizobium sp. vgs-9]|uniref:hypothetical protein n=1 Tax=Bradyrhizobium sp. vgs-9 TaxID=208389 RepID=UPI0035D42865
MALKSKDVPHLRLRVEAALLTRLTKSAEKNDRTLTGEISERLEASFKRDDMNAAMEATAEKISERLLAAVGADRETRAQIFNEEMFKHDLEFMCEFDPKTPRAEHARRLRELHKAREKRYGK